MKKLQYGTLRERIRPVEKLTDRDINDTIKAGNWEDVTSYDI